MYLIAVRICSWLLIFSACNEIKQMLFCLVGGLGISFATYAGVKEEYELTKKETSSD